LLAVEIYNKPRTAFKSSGFIVLMSIAYTALFHAHFEKEGVKYFYRKKNSRRFETIEGDYKAWELTKCAEEYLDSKDNPIFRNLELVFKLRNKIEHRFIPEIDSHILGECQAMLINFENMLESHFGPKHSISDLLNIPLQISRGRRRMPLSSEAQEVLDFVRNYRSSVSKKVRDSQKFSFKVFLIPKIGNHRNTSDIAMEFVDFDLASKDQQDNLEKIQTLIKDRQVPVANQGKYKPTSVVAEITNRTGVEFNVSWHTDMWKKYKVRPDSTMLKKEKCITKYCQYDVVHNDYVYTEEWINHLIKKEIIKG